jgi:ribosomal protein S18 acetylase RimI-like enzyme
MEAESAGARGVDMANDIRRLLAINAALLGELIVGYTTTEVYEVSRVETPEHTGFDLRLALLKRPFVKQYPHLEHATIERYVALAAQGHCFAAFADGRCVGIALTEPQMWNRSLWVHEFHVAASQHGRGVGRRLMETLITEAHASGLRCVGCETQSTNVPAIRFYRAMGFALEGIDLSFYSNRDRERGEVAVFMRRLLDGEEPSAPH